MVKLTERQRRNLEEQLEIEIEITKRLCYKSYYHFVKTMWPIIEPTTPFVDGWHIRAICKHLEAVAEFKIQKLIFNMPPRHMKSILTSVLFPAWGWLKNPSRRFIYASYAESLAIRDSIKTRMVIESDQYKTMFSPAWSLSDDENQKKRFSNSSTGARLAVGVGGALTGEGADHLFIDDPVNALDSLSDIILESANNWHDLAFATRYNNPQRHTKVITMQRLNENDLTGHVLAKTKGEYERLILPARFDPSSELKSLTSLNFKDPRKEKGELLWPEHFSEEALQDLESDLDRIGNAEAQLQQDPKPKSGGLFHPDWWQEFELWPSTILEIVQFWDCAQKPGLSNDYSVCATWAKTQNGYYILDVWREKTTAPFLEEMAISLYDKFRPSNVVIEDASAGSSLIQYLLLTTTIPVTPYSPDKNKEVRATAATPTVKAKKVFLPKGAPWVKDFMKEHEKFPKAKHDDQVDTTSMAIEYFKKFGNFAPRVRSI